MPSDLPSQTPPGAAAPTGSTAAPTATGANTTGGLTAGSGGTVTDVRRYSAQTGVGSGEKSSAISNSFALAMIVAFAVVAAVMVRQGPGLLQPPPRELVVVPQGSVAATVPAAPVIAANSMLVRAYGSGTVNHAGREARRLGQAGALAALCGLRSRAWVNDVREAIAKQMTAEYPTFDPEVNAVMQMQMHIIASYAAGQETAQQALNERGKETLCTDLPYSPDYRKVLRAGEQANIGSR